ncbi:MAG: hypothetical protein N2688_00075 [Burkholderiaceae bacterium]|nr:hypothetical protein [Burkholderiaceae bacterium]
MSRALLRHALRGARAAVERWAPAAFFVTAAGFIAFGGAVATMWAWQASQVWLAIGLGLVAATDTVVAAIVAWLVTDIADDGDPWPGLHR